MSQGCFDEMLATDDDVVPAGQVVARLNAENL